MHGDKKHQMIPNKTRKCESRGVEITISNPSIASNRFFLHFAAAALFLMWPSTPKIFARLRVERVKSITRIGWKKKEGDKKYICVLFVVFSLFN